jgi:hypothetical protein
MRNILALLALSSMACGGSVVSENPSTHTEEAKLEGSYELTLGDVTVTADTSWPGGTTPPSKGRVVRVDIAKTAGGFEASIAPAFGLPGKFAASVAADAVTLTGEGVAIASGGSGMQTSDRWTKLVLARDASGALSGAVSLEGVEDVFAGDVGWTGSIAGTGAIGADTHAPELRPYLVSPTGPGDALLPWDPVIVDASEPVSRDALTKSLQPGAPIVWASESDAPSWPGVMTVIGRATSFDVGAVPLTLTKPLADLAGNARTSFTASLKFLAVGAPRATYDFESKVAAWNATFVSAPSMGCAGTCAKIGPVSVSACGAGRAGLAVRTPAASSIAVRYRIVVDAYEGSSETPPVYGSALSIDVATPGSAATTTAVTFDAAKLKPLEGSTAKATDWETATAPGGAKELGITLRAGDRVHEGYCDGFAPAPATVTYYVDSIVAK